MKGGFMKGLAWYLLRSMLEFLGEASLGVRVETHSGNENDDVEELRRVNVQARCRLWV